MVGRIELELDIVPNTVKNCLEKNNQPNPFKNDGYLKFWYLNNSYKQQSF